MRLTGQDFKHRMVELVRCSERFDRAGQHEQAQQLWDRAMRLVKRWEKGVMQLGE